MYDYGIFCVPTTYVEQYYFNIFIFIVLIIVTEF
jgi:hypothetical protein